MIARRWRRDWEHITPFLSLPPDLRRVVYTTNSIEAMHRQVRKASKTRGAFPDEQAAIKLIWLAIDRAEKKWRRAYHWTRALAGLKIHFEDRLPDLANGRRQGGPRLTLRARMLSMTDAYIGTSCGSFERYLADPGKLAEVAQRRARVTPQEPGPSR